MGSTYPHVCQSRGVGLAELTPCFRPALNASLRRLGRNQVDLYQSHGWDPLTHRRDVELP
jgi:hypothetical protein